ncbi:MAG: DUF2889 domain-containing protein [Deltaproteobacteria bacterium]|nr:DUF2889 domain-containing protein [Deltaproteobacteria bacterium]
MTLNYLRNKVVEVESRSNGDLVVSWRLSDDLLKAEVRLIVQLPELEIIEAEARMERLVPLSLREASEKIKKVEGVSIGSGLRKILAGLLGEPAGNSFLMDAVLECSNAVILHFTRPAVETGESITNPEEKLARTREMVKSNPRLIRSCISFQDDSPIMKGLAL